MPEEKCYICEKMAVDTKNIIIDQEACQDVDDEGNPIVTMQGIWAEVRLCEEHLEEYLEREGNFEPYDLQ